MEKVSAWTTLCTPGGEFRHGTQVGGVAATPLLAGWLNMIQQELISVVDAAGLPLSKDDRNQVLLAIRWLISDAGNAWLRKDGGRMSGLLEAFGGIRAMKGLPLSGNTSRPGYAFGADGNTGLFAVNGNDADGSDLLLVVDGSEVLRVKQSGALSIPGSFTLMGSQTPYHTGNKSDILALVYPVGSVYMNASASANPGTLFGFGAWVALAPGRMLVGAGSATDSRGEARSFPAGESGGEFNHVLAADEMPAHSHSMPQGTTVPGTGGPYAYASGDDVTTSTMDSPPPSGEAGGGGAHNNMPPYLTVYMWRRTG